MMQSFSLSHQPSVNPTRGAFVPCMGLSRPESYSSSHRGKEPKTICDNSRLLSAVHQAVQDDHLGHALNILSENPHIHLPDHTVQELAAKLRMRGLRQRADLITRSLNPSALSIVQILSRSRRSDFNDLPHTDKCTRTPLQDLIEQGSLDKVFQILETVDSLNVTAQTLESLIDVSGAVGQIKKAELVLNDIFPKFAVPPTTAAFVAFIDACGRAGCVHRALAVLKSPGFSLLFKEEQSLVCCKLVDACVRCDALAQADSVIERMRVIGVPVTENVYVALLNASARSFSLDRSLRVLNLMRKDGFSPRTLATYNAILLGASRAGRIEDALSVYSTMMSSESVTPDMNTYNALLACCAKAGDPDRAFEVLNLMCSDHSVHPNAKSFNWVVVACARVGDVDRALQVARRMRHEGIRLNVVTNNNLLEACCNAGRLERAFAMVKDMIQNQGIEPNSHTYDILIRGCGRWGLLDAALRLLSSMQSAGVSPTIITYSVAIDACARAGGAVAVDRAFDILSQMESAGLEPNTVTFNSVIHACAQGRRAELAFEVFERMVRDGVPPDIVTLCSLVGACGRAGDVESAFKVIESVPRRFPNLRPNVPAYNALMHACFKAGNLERMEQAFSVMKRCNLNPSVVTFSTLVSAYAANGDVNKALSYLRNMKDLGMSPNRMIFTSMIAAYGRSGEVTLAMDMFHEACTTCEKPDEELYTAAIVAAIGGGRKELAVQLANEMSRAGYFVPTVLNRIMRKVGFVERSGAELHRVMKAMEALKIRPQRAALESLITAYAKEADVRSAMDVLPDMERLGYPPNIQTYKKLIQACALSGTEMDINQAISLFEIVRSRVNNGDPQLSSHNWQELYEAILRACNKLPAQVKTATTPSFITRMRADCGEKKAEDIMKRLRLPFSFDI